MNLLIAKYLKEENHFAKIDNFNDAYLSHPNFPSLLAITDSLTQIETENIAANVSFANIDQLPNYFIGILKIESDGFYFIKKNQSNFVIENEKEVKKVVSSEELEKYWTGIVLIIEENETSQTTISINKSNFIFPFLFTAFVLIAIFNYNYHLLDIIFLLISGIGVFVSIEILKTYFENDQNKESKFCSISENFSCNSIITSKNYAFSKYIEFVDLPIIFFSTAFLSQVLGVNSIYFVGFASLLSFPFLIYSVYLQKFVVKKWCVLCLVISFLMIAMGVLFFINYHNINIQYPNLISTLLLLLLISMSWFLLKKQLLVSKKNLQKLHTLLRFKRKQDVFSKISDSINNKEEFESLEKIVIGDTTAKNTLTLFLSPSCPHCHTAYKTAIALIKKHKELLKLEVCFNVNINNTNNPYLIVYKTILSLYNSQNKEYMLALEDWHIKKQSLDDWKKTWFFENDFTEENNQIEKQYQWCLDANLNHTPIKIFNANMIPDIYELNELVYFFKE